MEENHLGYQSLVRRILFRCNLEK